MNVAIITARAGSKSIPDKNTYPVAGRPLVSYPARAASEASRVARCFVSTDGESIAEAARAEGCEVIVRPDELAGDTINHGDVIRHAVDYVDSIYPQLTNVVLLLGNTVMVDPELIDQCLEVLEREPDVDSVMTVWEAADDHPYRALEVVDGLVQAWSGKPTKLSTERQSYPQIYYYDQGVWAFRKHCVHEETGPQPWWWMGRRCRPIIRTWTTGRDIHTHFDRLVAEAYVHREAAFRREETRESPLLSRPPLGQPRVAITTTSFPGADSPLRNVLKEAGLEVVENPYGRRLTEQESILHLSGCVGVIAGTSPLTREVLSALPGLRVVSRVGVGLDNIDLAAARQLGISVRTTPEQPAVAVAELTVGLIISLMRRIGQSERKLRLGEWSTERGSGLAGKTVGIVGLGRVGRRLVRLLAPHEVVFKAVEPSPPAGRFLADFEVELLGLEEVLEVADIVTLHLPLTASTAGLIGARELDQMKPNAVIVNTSRGGIVDEAALVAALKNGSIAGAGIDTFAQEPYHGFLSALDNVVITPHIGTATRETREAMEMESVENLLAVLAEKGYLRR